MNPEHANPPQGNPTDVLPRKPRQKFCDELRNMAWQRDQATKRNKLYLGLMALCVLSVVFAYTTLSFKTYVVRVDNTTGAIETGGELVATNYSPKDAEINYFLTNFIRQTRSVPLDPVVLSQNWNIARHFMSEAAFAKYSQMVADDPPAAKIGQATVQPEIKTIQLYPGTNNTYQIRWYEQEMNLSGEAKGTRRDYTGLFQIAINSPTKEEKLTVNPLGLTIIDCTYTLESDTALDKS